VLYNLHVFGAKQETVGQIYSVKLVVGLHRSVRGLSDFIMILTEQYGIFACLNLYNHFKSPAAFAFILKNFTVRCNSMCKNRPDYTSKVR